MKGLVGIILGIVMLLAGCGRSVDSRLSLADSLIDEQADSAYVVLKGVNADELTRSSDRAYYALLYTQAQYKNFDSIPNDSLINIALHHYSDNHNRELYTRTLIYKGAVMQELGNETEAMEWYKRAEDNASPDDYMNLGQANLRMSVLYALNYADNDETLEKERRALYYFRKAESKRYELMCLGGLGGGYRQCNMDSAYYYLHQAITLAKELKDDNRLYLSTEMLARAYNEDSLYAESKALSLDYLANNGTDHIDDDIYYDLAYSYAKIGMADSAQFYFDKTAEHLDEAMNVTRLIVYSLITECENNYTEAHKYNKTADSLAYKIIQTGKSIRMESINNRYDLEKITNEKESQSILFYRLLFVLLIIGVFALILIHRKHTIKIENAKALINSLHQEKEILLSIKDKISISSKVLAENHFSLLNDLVDCSYVYANQPEMFVKRFNEIIEKGKPKSHFWQMLYIYIDENSNNFITNLRKEYTELKEDDIKVISMLCCGYSALEISLYLGYVNNTYIYKKKKLIAKKLALSTSLDEFLKDHIIEKEKSR